MKALLWIRGFIFTALVPVVVAYLVPSALDPNAHPAGGIWNFGWVPILAGALTYLWCLIGFLALGGTPAIFFTRHIRFLLGEEPTTLVATGLYR